MAEFTGMTKDDTRDEREQGEDEVRGEGRWPTGDGQCSDQLRSKISRVRSDSADRKVS